MTTLNGQYLRDPPSRLSCTTPTQRSVAMDPVWLVASTTGVTVTIVAKDQYGNQIDQVTNDTFMLK